MNEKLTPKEARTYIDGKLVARMIMDFHHEFAGIYPEDVMTSNLCAVGPLQAMIGLAIQKSRLEVLGPPVTKPRNPLVDATIAYAMSVADSLK